MEESKEVVFAEVYQILRCIDKEKVMKIPAPILQQIRDERDKNIPVEIDWENLLEKERFCKNTINILGYFNYYYWAESKEEKENLAKIYNIPIIKEEIGEITDVFNTSKPNKELNNNYKNVEQQLTVTAENAVQNTGRRNSILNMIKNLFSRK